MVATRAKRTEAATPACPGTIGVSQAAATHQDLLLWLKPLINGQSYTRVEKAFKALRTTDEQGPTPCLDASQSGRNVKRKLHQQILSVAKAFTPDLMTPDLLAPPNPRSNNLLSPPAPANAVQLFPDDQLDWEVDHAPTELFNKGPTVSDDVHFNKPRPATSAAPALKFCPEAAGRGIRTLLGGMTAAELRRAVEVLGVAPHVLRATARTWTRGDDGQKIWSTVDKDVIDTAKLSSSIWKELGVQAYDSSRTRSLLDRLAATAELKGRLNSYLQENFPHRIAEETPVEAILASMQTRDLALPEDAFGPGTGRGAGPARGERSSVRLAQQGQPGSAAAGDMELDSSPGDWHCKLEEEAEPAEEEEEEEEEEQDEEQGSEDYDDEVEEEPMEGFHPSMARMLLGYMTYDLADHHVQHRTGVKTCGLAKQLPSYLSGNEPALKLRHHSMKARVLREVENALRLPGARVAYRIHQAVSRGGTSQYSLIVEVELRMRSVRTERYHVVTWAPANPLDPQGTVRVRTSAGQEATMSLLSFGRLRKLWLQRQEAGSGDCETQPPTVLEYLSTFDVKRNVWREKLDPSTPVVERSLEDVKRDITAGKSFGQVVGAAAGPEPPQGWRTPYVVAVREECDVSTLLAGFDHLKGHAVLQHIRNLRQQAHALEERMAESEVPELGKATAADFQKILQACEKSRYPVPQGLREELGRSLKVPLKAFQVQALAMMIGEEDGPGSHGHIWADLPLSPRTLSYGLPLRIFYSPLLGAFRWGESWRALRRRGDEQLAVSPARGGFLCLEMGMGKTAVALALVALRPPPPAWRSPDWTPALRDDWDTGVPGTFARAGTLVVVPQALLCQWKMEAAKFTGVTPAVRGDKSHGTPGPEDQLRCAAPFGGRALRVLEYYSKAQRPASALLLSQYDVVLTTPKLAEDELLNAVEWYRIIVDEAHQDAQASNAVRLKAARSRWCLTGTPVAFSVTDSLPKLWSVLELLDVRAVVQRPRKLGAIMAALTVRFTKEGEVDGQPNFDAPPLRRQVLRLDFNWADEKSYELLHKKVVADLDAAIEKAKIEGKPLPSFRKNQLLRQLRLACSGGTVEVPLKQEQEDDEEEDDEEDDGWGGAGKENHASNYLKGDRGGKKGPAFSGATQAHSFKTKPRALVSELKALHEREPMAKVLIFSSFPETLKELQQRLVVNGFKFRTMDGSMSKAAKDKALRDFRLDPPTTVFLLSAHVAALGLTLVAASHVYLMEPQMNLNQEMQAVSRCHRLGQEKVVTVTHMLLRDSVEQRVYDLARRRQAGGAVPVEAAATVPMGGFMQPKGGADLLVLDDLNGQDGLEEFRQLFL